MKRVLLICILLRSFYSHAQPALETRNMQFVEIYDKEGRPLTSSGKNKIKGSPHLSDEWGRGSVKFLNGRTLPDATLQYNIHTNQLHYRIDSIEFIIIDPIAEFSLDYVLNGQSHTGLFRCGYPSQGPLPENTFYEVLAEGPRFHLLKRNYKSVQDFFDYSAAPAKIYRYTSEMFLWDVRTRHLLAIKNRASLPALMPEQAEAIERLSGSKNFKFQSEKELAALVRKLE